MYLYDQFNMAVVCSHIPFINAISNSQNMFSFVLFSAVCAVEWLLI